MDNSTHNEMSAKLIRYLDGEITGDEKADFEKLIAGNTALQEELERLRLAREAIVSYGLKQKVAALHQQMMRERTSRGGPKVARLPVRRYVLAIAASLLIVFAGAVAYQYFSVSGKKIFAANYVSYELVTPRGGEPGSGNKSEVEKLYREKKYADVVGIGSSRPFTIKEDFLRAMSFTELGNNEKAIAGFNEVIAKNERAASRIFKDEAEYYLALVYLRNLDYDQGLALMNKIHNDKTHLYHQKITDKLLRQVRRLK